MKDRKTRKEEEKRILLEMDEAMRAVRRETSVLEQNERDTIQSAIETPEEPSRQSSQTIYCRRCKSALGINGVCPVCGERVYMPMDENKRKKIRLIVAGVCIVGFLILYCIVK